MAAHLARTTLARDAPPPCGTLADLIALGAHHGMEERRVMEGLQIWREMEALRWSDDGARFEFVLPTPRT
eukprot:3377887-Alexandrium_andersonii.AAC.1